MKYVLLIFCMFMGYTITYIRYFYFYKSGANDILEKYEACRFGRDRTRFGSRTRLKLQDEGWSSTCRVGGYPEPCDTTRAVGDLTSVT